MGTDLQRCGGGGVDCSLRERLRLARLEDSCADARNLPRSLVARLARWSWQRSIEYVLTRKSGKNHQRGAARRTPLTRRSPCALPETATPAPASTSRSSVPSCQQMGSVPSSLGGKVRKILGACLLAHRRVSRLLPPACTASGDWLQRWGRRCGLLGVGTRRASALQKFPGKEIFGVRSLRGWRAGAGSVRQRAC